MIDSNRIYPEVTQMDCMDDKPHEFTPPLQHPFSRSPSRSYTQRCQSALLLLLVATLMFTGCASIHKRNPLPNDFDQLAEIPGIPRARIWGDAPPVQLMPRFEALSKTDLKKNFPGIVSREHHYLSISGGGANGAFGAGLLVGWTETGNRPEFTMVTGISTGALAAPFAFLGPAYDPQLKEIFTTYTTDDLFKNRNIIAFLTGDSALDSTPLYGLITRYFNQEIIDAIAEEHHRGRNLLIGTTDLDTLRPVIWDITQIAASGYPGATELIHKIFLASATIPGVLPPVFFDVTTEGNRYDEIHVDGGTTSQVFLYPAGVDWNRVMEMLDVKGKPRVYLIRNAYLATRRKAVIPRLVNIAGSSINSLIRTQGIGDIYRMYLSAQKDGLDYNLAYIPMEFDRTPQETFDREYMRALFDLSYRMSKEGFPWEKAPPGFK
jgi:hypothetical protein